MMRVLFVKPDCPFCGEMLISVDIFNKKHPTNQIDVINIHLPTSKLYTNIILEAFGEIIETPSMIFDGRLILGTAGWKENLSYLDELNKGVNNA